MPAHLRVSFRVVDSRGKVLDEGKDLAALQETAGPGHPAGHRGVPGRHPVNDGAEVRREGSAGKGSAGAAAPAGAPPPPSRPGPRAPAGLPNSPG